MLLYVNICNAGDQSGIGRALEAQLAACAVKSDYEQKARLVAWLAEVQPDLFAARIVRPLQRYIGAIAARQVPFLFWPQFGSLMPSRSSRVSTLKH